MRKKQRKRRTESPRWCRPLDYDDPVVRSLRRELIRNYPRKLRSTAAHEAGHCLGVAMLGLGMTIESVTILPDSESLGRVDYGRRPRDFHWTDQFQEMVINYAGNLGRTLAIKATCWDHWNGRADMENSYDIASELFGVPPEVAERWYLRDDPTAYAIAGTLRRAEGVAREMILSPFGRIAVLLLAKALLERKTLTGEEVRQIIWHDTERLMMESYPA